MRVALILLAFASLSFAASGWEGTAMVAIAISAGFLGVAYATGVGFGVNELQMLAKEELYQLIATGVLVVLLVGSNNVIDGMSSAFGDGEFTTLQSTADGLIDGTLTNSEDGMETLFGDLMSLDNTIAREGARMISCSIVSIGYTVSACGGYSMLSTPLSMGSGILGFAIGELYSMKKLIDISTSFAMNLLLPLGIVLRTFKITRGAGGFLIAMGISMHILLPMGIVFNQMLVDTFLADPAGSGYDGGMTASVPECDPDDVLFSGLGESQAEKAIGLMYDLRDDLRKVVFSVLVRGTLGPVLSLLMMAAGIRAISSLAGAEVDVSALGRFI